MAEAELTMAFSLPATALARQSTLLAASVSLLLEPKVAI